MQKHPNVQIIMKLFAFAMLSLVPSVTVCSVFPRKWIFIQEHMETMMWKYSSRRK